MADDVKVPVTFYATKSEKQKFLRDAGRLHVTLTEFLTSGLQIGLPVVRKTLRKARRDQQSVTEKTKVSLKD